MNGQMNRRWLWAVVLGAVALAGCGPSGEESAPASPHVNKQGPAPMPGSNPGVEGAGSGVGDAAKTQARTQAARASTGPTDDSGTPKDDSNAAPKGEEEAPEKPTKSNGAEDGT